MANKNFKMLTVVFVLVFLNACSGLQPDFEDNHGLSSGDKDLPVELSIWQPSRTNSYLTKKNEEFMEKYPGIRLNVITHEGDPGNDYFQAIASGTAPDTVLVSRAMLPRYIDAGILLDLTGYVENWKDKDSFGKQYLERGERGGKIYGIPTGLSIPMVLGYNKRLFRETGLKDAPANWEEMLNYARKLTNIRKQQYGFGMLSAQWTDWWFQFFVWQAGGDLTHKNTDETLTLTFTDPAVMKAADFYKALAKARVIQNDLTMDFESLIKNFAAGRFGMTIMGCDAPTWLISLGMKAEDLGIAVLPAGPAGKSVASVSGSHFVINPRISKEKQDAAWEYIKWQTTREFLSEELKDFEASGVVNPVICERTDLKTSDVVKIRPDWAEASQQAMADSRDEYYCKSIVSNYVNMAVQKIIVDPNANPEKEFTKAQEAAENEVVKAFNSSIKAK